MRYLIVLLLSGCAAMSPQDLERAGTRRDATSALPVREAASCLTRNAEEYRWGVGGIGGTSPATIRDGREPGTMEVLMPGVVFGRIAPAGSGSRITLWFGDMPVYGMAAFPDAMLKGC